MKIRLFAALLSMAVLTASGAEPSFFQLHSVAAAAGASTKEYSYKYKNNPPETLHLNVPALLDGSAIKSATVERNQDGQPETLVAFTEEGARKFGEITTKHVGKRIAILLGGRIHTVPTINEAITGGSASITGNFSDVEAAELAKKLNAVSSK